MYCEYIFHNSSISTNQSISNMKISIRDNFILNYIQQSIFYGKFKNPKYGETFLETS